MSTKWFGIAPDALSSILLAFLVLITVIDVTGRELLNQPLPGSTDLTRLVLVILIFTVLPRVSARETHIAVDLIDFIYPPSWTHLRDGLINLLGGAFLLVMAHRVWSQATTDAHRNLHWDYLGLPIAPMTYYVAIMAAVTGFVLLLNAGRHFARQTLPREQRLADAGAISAGAKLS